MIFCLFYLINNPPLRIRSQPEAVIIIPHSAQADNDWLWLLINVAMLFIKYNKKVMVLL